MVNKDDLGIRFVKQQGTQNRSLGNSRGNICLTRNLSFHCNPLLPKNLGKTSRRFPLIPFFFNLKGMPLRQSLSNAFDISRNTPLTSYYSSNDLYMSRDIDSNWIMLPGLKPHWFLANSLFSIKI